MFRRFKCLLVTSCALLVIVIVFLQLRSQNMTIRDTFGQFNIQTLSSNGSVIPVPVASQQAVPAADNPIPSESVLRSMSHKDLQAFYHSYVNSPQTTCSKVERMGKITDGGWEFCDDPLYRPPKGECLVYSYGINFDFSFDDDMANYGCEVHAFDPSMNTAPYLRGERVYFHPVGIGDKSKTVLSPTKSAEWQLHTMGVHRKMLEQTPEQRRLHIVKIDVEGYELESLMAALDEGSLSDVQQLAFETHVAWGNYDPTVDNYVQFLGLLRKVYEKGFRIYMTHRNYMYSAFESLLVKGKSRVYCHEIHTVNINLKNKIKPDGSIDGAVSDDKRQEWQNQQKKLLSNEQALYTKLQLEKQKQLYAKMNTPVVQAQPPVQVQPPAVNQPQAQPQVQPQIPAQGQPQSQVQNVPQTQVQAQPQAQVQNEPQAQPQAQVQNQPQVKPQNQS